MKEGYIYILINASLQKNTLKIGMTRRTPEIRAGEMSEETGLPSEYIVAHERKVSDCEEAEALIHERLKRYRTTQTRYDRSREFFMIPFKKARPIFDEIADQFQDSTQNIPMDLEWAVGPDKDKNWHEARSWVQSLNFHEGGWRMPTLDELGTLYINKSGMQKICSLLKTTGWGVWSDETKGSSSAWGFNFSLGRRYCPNRSYSTNLRAFAVRSGAMDNLVTAIPVVNAVADQFQADAHSSSTPHAEFQHDGIYVAYANGIVKDTETGLEWKAGPDKDTDWNEARSWVQSLNLDGGGWKMPSTDGLLGLAGLYKKGSGDRNMTPLLKITGWWVWSGETKGSSDAWGFYFNGGNRRWDGRNTSHSRRACAVRYRSDG